MQDIVLTCDTRVNHKAGDHVTVTGAEAHRLISLGFAKPFKADFKRAEAIESEGMNTVSNEPEKPATSAKKGTTGRKKTTTNK